MEIVTSRSVSYPKSAVFERHVLKNYIQNDETRGTFFKQQTKFLLALNCKKYTVLLPSDFTK